MVDPRLMKKFPDTSYPVGEALANAERWWSEYRGAVNRDLTTRIDEKVRTGAGVPMLRSIRESEDVPSGILGGKAWKELTEIEHAYVTKVWHHFHIRVPQLSQADADGRTKQVLKMRCDSKTHPPELPTEQTFEALTRKEVHKAARSEGWHITLATDFCPWCHAQLRFARMPTAGSA